MCHGWAVAHPWPPPCKRWQLAHNFQAWPMQNLPGVFRLDIAVQSALIFPALKYEKGIPRASGGTGSVGPWLFTAFSFVGSRSSEVGPCRDQGWQCFVGLEQRFQGGKTLNIYHLWGTLLIYGTSRPLPSCWHFTLCGEDRTRTSLHLPKSLCWDTGPDSNLAYSLYQKAYRFNSKQLFSRPCCTCWSE